MPCIGGINRFPPQTADGQECEDFWSHEAMCGAMDLGPMGRNPQCCWDGPSDSTVVARLLLSFNKGRIRPRRIGPSLRILLFSYLSFLGPILEPILPLIMEAGQDPLVKMALQGPRFHFHDGFRECINDESSRLHWPTGRELPLSSTSSLSQG